MQEPINCPKCNLPLVNDLSKNRKGQDIIVKSCFKKPDHKIIYQVAGGLYGSFLSFRDNITMVQYVWFFERNELHVFNKGNKLTLPYFEPDFSNPRKLMDKLKMYITFS